MDEGDAADDLTAVATDKVRRVPEDLVLAAFLVPLLRRWQR